MNKLEILAKRKSNKISLFLNGNLQLANPIIRVQKAFHNMKYPPDARTASDPYQSGVGRYIGPASGCRYQSDIKMAYLT